MAPTFTRTPTAHSPTLTLHSGAHKVHWTTPTDSNSVHEISHFSTTYARNTPRAQNPNIPPYHWHWYQNERFAIKRGAFIFTLEGQEIRRTADDAPVQVLAHARHTFRVDPDCGEEEAIIEITASPEESGLSERFFRNVYCYLDDCEKASVAPSLVQMLMFLDSAEVSLAFPGPRWMANPLSWAVGVVGGRWLGWAMGYQDSYVEYWDPKGEKKA